MGSTVVDVKAHVQSLLEAKRSFKSNEPDAEF